MVVVVDLVSDRLDKLEVVERWVVRDGYLAN